MIESAVTPTEQNTVQRELKLLKGQEVKNLVENWKKEMDTRQDSWPTMIGISGLIRMAWWGYFKQYRLCYFMIMCMNGMATFVAWNQAKTWKKEDIVERINSYGWSI